MAYLQLDRYQKGYFHNILVEYYSLGENQATEAFYLKFIYKLNLCWHFGATKSDVGRIFGIWIFLSEKTKLQILPEQKSSWAHIIFIYKSYNENVD